jgi:hypothetical protein
MQAKNDLGGTHNMPHSSADQSRRHFLSNLARGGAATLGATVLGTKPSIAAAGDLLWFRHLGRSDGTNKWVGGGAAAPIDSGWQKFRLVFAADDGVIYAVDKHDKLHWYQHSGRSNGTATFAGPNLLGSGWGFPQMFAADDSVIYVLAGNPPPQLNWYQHLGRSDGSKSFANAGVAITVGTDWNFKQVFAANDGVIYAIDDAGGLFWYRHIGRSDGSTTFAANAGAQIATGWNYKQVCAADDGVIYGLTGGGSLHWFRHIGRSAGTSSFANGGSPKVVATGWNYRKMFAAGESVIYAVV